MSTHPDTFDRNRHYDTYEALARRCEQGAAALDHEAEHAAEILPTRMGGDKADPQQWADRKLAGARAAREYAADLRAQAGDAGTLTAMSSEQRAEADRVASAAELGGILIDGRRMAERNAHGDRLFNDYERELWDAGKHTSQEKAREIEATGKFTHVAETINGIEQVPFWQLGSPVDEATAQPVDRRDDGNEDEA